MADKIELKGSSKELLKSVAEAIGGLKNLDSVIKGQISEITNYNKKGELANKTIKAMSASGKQLNVVLENTAKGLQLVSSNTKIITQDFERGKKSTLTYAQELKNIQKEFNRIETNKSTANKFTRDILSNFTGFQNLSLSDKFSFKQQLVDLENLVKAHNISAYKINKIWGELSRGQVNAYRDVIDRKLQGSLVNLHNTIKTPSIKKEVDSINLSWRTMVRIIEIQLVRRAISFLIRGMREAFQESLQLSRSIAEIQTISQNLPLDFSRWANELIKVSDSFGIDAVNQAEAAYQALSNQIAEGTQVIDFLITANKLAVTTVSNTSDSVNALTAVLNAYGKSVIESDNISAQLFKTVELGRVRLSEMSNSIGNIAVPASTLGISFEELTAIIATLTIRGIKYTESATQIRGIILKLIKPTEEMKNLLDKWGFSSGQAAVRSLGFLGVLEELSKETGDSASELGELINRVRGLIGILSLTGKGRKDYINNLEEIKNSNESFEKGFKLVLENLGKKLEIELNKFRNILNSIAINNILPFIDKLVSGMENLNSVLLKVTGTIAGLATGGFIGILLSSSIKIITHINGIITALKGLIKTSALFTSAAINPIVAIIITTIVGTLTAAGYILGKRTAEIIKRNEEIRKSWEEIWKEQEDITKKVLLNIVKSQIDAVKDIEKNELSALANRKRFLNEEHVLRLKLLNSVISESKKLNKSLTEETKNNIESVKNIIKEAETLIKNSKNAIDDLTKESNTKIFDLRLESIEKVEEKIRFISEEINSLRNKSLIFVRANDLESLKDAQSRIRELFLLQNKLETDSSKTDRDPKRLQKLIDAKKLSEPISSAFKLGKDSEVKPFTIDNYTKLIDEQKKQLEEINKNAVNTHKLETENLKNLESLLDNLKIKTDIYKEIPKDVDKATDSLGKMIKTIDDLQIVSDNLDLINIKNQANTLLDIINQNLNVDKQQNDVIQESNRKQEEINKASKAVAESLSLNKESASSIFTLQNELNKTSDIFYNSTDKNLIALGLTTDFLKEELSELEKGLLTNDISVSKLDNTISVIDDYAKKLANQESISESLITALNNALVNLNQLKTFYQENETVLDPFTEKIRGQKKAVDELNSSITTLFDSNSNLINILSSANELTNTGTNLTRKFDFSKTYQKISGFASGGSVQASDTVPALLTPGEFVVNKDSAKRFYTQLVAINRAKGYASGGTVTNNTNVGDINMNITNSGNIDYDLNKFSRMYKRAIHRGLLTV